MIKWSTQEEDITILNFKIYKAKVGKNKKEKSNKQQNRF